MLAHSDPNYSVLLVIVGANGEPLRAGAGAIRARYLMYMKHTDFDLASVPNRYAIAAALSGR